MPLTPPHVYAARGWSTQVAYDIALEAHAGAVDKLGVDYFEHPKAVAALVAPFGEKAVQVALLHDVLEDTDWTAQMLAQAGAPDDVLAGVVSMTKDRSLTREQNVRRAASDPLGRIGKAADNRHNGDPERNARIADPVLRARLAAQYERDRRILDEYGAPVFP